jgi:hypothetical protein
MGKAPIPTVPSTRNGGIYKYIYRGVSSNGDDDWESVALGGALTILFSLLFFLPDSLLFHPSNLHEVVQRARASYNPRSRVPGFDSRVRGSLYVYESVYDSTYDFMDDLYSRQIGIQFSR